jgi:hypothetical protein
VNLQKDSLTEKLDVVRIFSDSIHTQAELDSARAVFLNLPFYKSLLYNADSNAYLMGVRINKDSLSSPKRSKIVSDITSVVNSFENNTNIKAHLSGLPLIRTVVADKIQKGNEDLFIGFIGFKRADPIGFFSLLSARCCFRFV